MSGPTPAKHDSSVLPDAASTGPISSTLERRTIYLVRLVVY
jgi:hypothetical protein